jgi:aerobic-type carbon monoxide dehydrogenase small subunit (CoxS/CutS family)
MAQISIVVNGRSRSVNVQSDTPLLWVLRDALGLTGTKYGCGVGVCGACTVLEGDSAVRSCQITAADAAGKRFTTIEGLSSDRSHPLQRAWIEEDVAQCGYCQAGMLLTASALLKAKPNATDADIDAALDQHVCRCGTYPRIRRAIHRAVRGNETP